MSQFLICKSLYDLSYIGSRMDEINENKELYEEVVERYYLTKEDIWVIDKIHEMVNDIKINIDSICTISEKCKKMIFWYGTDYEDLEQIFSTSELRTFLERYYDDPCVEIYLTVEIDKQSI